MQHKNQAEARKEKAAAEQFKVAHLPAKKVLKAQKGAENEADKALRKERKRVAVKMKRQQGGRRERKVKIQHGDHSCPRNTDTHTYRTHATEACFKCLFARLPLKP